MQRGAIPDNAEKRDENSQMPTPDVTGRVDYPQGQSTGQGQSQQQEELLEWPWDDIPDDQNRPPGGSSGEGVGGGGEDVGGVGGDDWGVDPSDWF
jgi:hypothetical protein